MSETKKVYKKPTITANQIRHFVGDVEVASVPETITRLGLEPKIASTVYNTIHSQRDRLMPDSWVYGSTYFYPAETVAKVVSEVHESIDSKKEQSDTVKRLLSKIRNNPEVAQVLLGLLDD